MVKKVRGVYARRMGGNRLARLQADLSDEDRFDLSSELAMYRESIATLVSMESQIAEKYPGRDDLLVPVQTQINATIDSMARTMKHAREIEVSGDVFTPDRVAALLDKVASLVTYHVTDEQERLKVLTDMNELASLFRRTAEQGTLVTPDQDVRMMDGTVPVEGDILCLDS